MTIRVTWLDGTIEDFHSLKKLTPPWSSEKWYAFETEPDGTSPKGTTVYINLSQVRTIEAL